MDNRCMQMDDLGLFARVAQTRSLSEAARQLELTPSAVSARIRRIEHELGVRLLERTTRSLRITVEGERFLQTCDTMSIVWARGQALLRDSTRALHGRVTIAAPSDLSAQYLAGWIGDFAASNERLSITLYVGDRLHDIPRDGADIAIRYGELSDSSLVSRLLVRSERVLVASPAYLRASPELGSPADLDQHRCLVWQSRDQPRVQWSFSAPDGATHTQLINPHLCGNGHIVREWALQGRGIAYKTLVDVQSDLKAGRLVRVLPSFEGECVPINAVMPSAKYVPARVRSVLDHLTEKFKADLG